ncbi:MAG: hypothetical protein AB7O44_24995 [Hyphomicrobiaceae bacterium]
MPRWVHYAFAALLGALAISLAVQAGWHSADALDGKITFAALYGGIAAFAVYGHALAADAWFDRQRVLAVVFFLIAACAVTMTVFNDLGAIATRNDALAGTRKAAKDAAADRRAELARVTAERSAMTFQPTTAEAAQAARDAVAVAEKVRAAECDKRGPHCRAREGEEGAKRDVLTAALSAKAATDRAALLDARAAALSMALSQQAAPANVNPQATIVARLTNSAIDVADAWLQIALSAMLELCVAATMINLERVRRREARTPEAAPKLAAAETPMQPGTISAFWIARLSLDDGATVGHREILDAYRVWCATSSPALAPLPPELFGRQFGTECRRLGVAMRKQGDGVVCVGVRLASSTRATRTVRPRKMLREEPA